MLLLAAIGCLVAPGLFLESGQSIVLEDWSGLLLVASIVSALVADPVAIARLRATMLAFPRRRLDRCPDRPAARTRWFELLCGRWPQSLRGRGVSLTLRILGVVVIAVSVLGSQLIGIDSASPCVRIIGYACSTAFLYLGNRAGSQSASRILEQDQRPPILFLRSFRDDGRGSFNLTDWRSTLLGIQAVQAAHVLGPLANSNPIRLFRLLVGRGGDTAEEQLAGYMRQHGPFIAIGRPREGLSTGGAARDYVSDDMWRARVDEWMSRARKIVIQPGATTGIWWEIERALAEIPRDKLIFCLLAFDGRLADYEAFALRLRAVVGADIPL